MNPQPRKYDDDDGRVICHMDVEGMRWQPRPVRVKEAPPANPAPLSPLTRAEARRYTWYAVKAGILVATVFSLGLILFTLFCTQIWFR